MEKSTQQRMRLRFYVSDSRGPKMIFAPRNGRSRHLGRLGNLLAPYLSVQPPERGALMEKSTQQRMGYRALQAESHDGRIKLGQLISLRTAIARWSGLVQNHPAKGALSDAASGATSCAAQKLVRLAPRRSAAARWDSGGEKDSATDGLSSPPDQIVRLLGRLLHLKDGWQFHPHQKQAKSSTSSDRAHNISRIGRGRGDRLGAFGSASAA